MIPLKTTEFMIAQTTQKQTQWVLVRPDVLKLDIDVHCARYWLQRAIDEKHGAEQVKQRLEVFESAISAYVDASLQPWEIKTNLNGEIAAQVRRAYRESDALYPDFYFHTYGEELPREARL